MNNTITKLDMAQEYVSLGFQIFPVHSIGDDGNCTCGKPDCRDAGKHPMTRHGVKDATDDPETIRRWFADGDCNIGLATGEASAVWVLDDDDLSANKPYTELLPPTWTVQTGSGKRHYFFLFNDNSRLLKNARIPSTKLDVRATGGYVVAPPSRHKSGGRYAWVVHPKDCPLAEAPDWLLAMCPKREAESVRRDDGGKGTGRGEAATVPAAPTVSPDAGVFRIRNGDDLADRARAYLTACPPAVSGQNGHRTAYSVVANVVELFGDLDDRELLGVLTEWNSRCCPPWSESELRHKITDAKRRTGTERRVTPDTQPSPVPDDDVDADDWRGRWTLDADAYHGLLGAIVQTVAPETEADPAGVLLSLLTAFGSAIGNGPRLPVGAGTHHGNLFTAIVGDTASGKGQAWEIVSRLMASADPDWSNDCFCYGLSSGEGFVERIRDDDNDDPLSVQPLKRLLCLETEFASPITAMRREGNRLSPILRSAWDCKTLEVLTRGKSKLKASNAYVSIVAHITPDELRKLMNGSIETVNGFGNRFLWCHVRSQRLLPHGGDISVLDGYGDRLRLAIETAKTIKEMRRSPDADRLWEDAYAELKRSRQGAYGRIVDRAAPQVVRLSMLYALADGRPIISVDHLKAALAVWRYCDASARLLFGEDDGDDPLETRIMDVLRDGSKTKTEIRQRLSSKDRPHYGETLDALVSAGRIRLDGDRYTLDAGRLDAARNVQRPESPESPASTTTMGLADLLDWRNENGVTFIRKCKGDVWVSQEYLLTDDIRKAIHAHQETLAAFVPMTETDDVGDLTLSVDGEAFLKELEAEPSGLTLEQAFRRYIADRSLSA